MTNKNRQDKDSRACRVLNSSDGRHWAAEGGGYVTWPHDTEAAALAELAELLQCTPSELRVTQQAIRGPI